MLCHRPSIRLHCAHTRSLALRTSLAHHLLHYMCSAFGELALLYSSPRAATVRASAPCKLWVMERGVYHAVKRNFTHEV